MILKLNRLIKYSLAISLISFLSSAPISQASSDEVKDKLVTILNEFKENNVDLTQFNFQSMPNRASINIQSGAPELSPFIIGGTTAPRFSYGEYVLLIAVDNSGEITGLCGGTMITPNKTLTAAHCAQTRASNTFLVPGFYSFDDRLTASSVFEVSGVSVHPGYNANTISNDVAVLTTRRTYSGPSAAVHSGSDLLVRSPATVIGTGLISTNPANVASSLQEVQTPITSNETCNAGWLAAAGITPIQSNMLCAGFPNDGRGSCSGDSGGPLFIEVDGKRVIAGTVSFGLSQCEINRGTSAYARMSSMTDYIRSQAPDTVFVALNNTTNAIIPVINFLLGDASETPIRDDGPQPAVPRNAPVPVIPVSFEGKYFISIESPLDITSTTAPVEATKYQYTQLNSNIRFSNNFFNGISFDLDGAGLLNRGIITRSEDWSWDMSTSRNSSRRLTVGVYENVIRYPFNDVNNGLSVSGLGSGCNQVFGRFRIFDIEYNGDELVKLVADFERSCVAGRAPLLGSIDFDASRADAVLPLRELPQGEPFPALPLLNEIGGVLIVEGTNNTFVVGAEGLRLDNSNSTFKVSPSFSSRELQININDYDYTLDLERPSLDIDPMASDRLEVGVYTLATRYPFNEPLAGLDFSGGGSGCNQIGGSFNIYEISYSSSGVVESLTADFTQNCGGVDSIRGSIRLNLPTIN